MKRSKGFYLIALLFLFASTAMAAEPVGGGVVPPYEKKVNWNLAVFLVDYQDIPAECRAQWPTALLHYNFTKRVRLD